MKEEQNEAPQDSDSFIFGTSLGAILEVTKLSPALFKVLSFVEAKLSMVYISLGQFAHAEWRYPSTSKPTGVTPLIDLRLIQDTKTFIDGEFLKIFLELSLQEQEKVMEAVNNLLAQS
jgi:hypothetical protein